MAHSHDHATLEVSLRARRVLSVIAGCVAVVIVIGMIALWPPAQPVRARGGFLIDDLLDAKVVALGTAPCSGTSESDDIECIRVTFRLTQGPDTGTTVNQEFPTGSAHPDLSVGDRVVLSYQKGAEPGFAYSYADRQRRPVLWALALMFAVAVVALGRLRGLSALAGLAASMVVILRFILPGILEGHSPVLVAVIGSAAIAYLALYLATGINVLTTVALLGTLSALAFTVGLSVLFTEIAQFTGRTSDESLVLELASGRIALSGLILASIVIGALGALDA